jgi:ribonuclease P protein component
MLHKKLRLDTASAKEVFMYPLSTHTSAHFILKLAKPKSSKSAQQSRFAVSVSKKTASTAVLRNRIRRRVYSALRPLVLGVVPGYMVGIVAKTGAEKITPEDLSKEIQDLLKKTRIFTAH